MVQINEEMYKNKFSVSKLTIYYSSNDDRTIQNNHSYGIFILCTLKLRSANIYLSLKIVHERVVLRREQAGQLVDKMRQHLEAVPLPLVLLL